MRAKPHIAFSVEDIGTASKGLKVLLEPFEVGGIMKIGFYETSDGGVIELM